MTTSKNAKNVKKTSKKLASPIAVGNTVLIRTVTMHYTGRIAALSKEEIVLEDAAWIADSGRFSTALATGSLNEVEPYPDGCPVSVNRGAVVDVAAWNHALPRQVK